MDKINNIEKMKYSLISQELTKIVKLAYEFDKDSPNFNKEFEKLINFGLTSLREIFKGNLILAKRIEDNRTYYAFSMDNVLVFECGVEEVDKEEDIQIEVKEKPKSKSKSKEYIN